MGSSTEPAPGLRTAPVAVPDLPPHHVDRPALRELLDLSVDRSLTLLSTPAGGGKTTLVASWARQAAPERPVFWMDGRAGGDVWTGLLGAITDAGLAPVGSSTVDGDDVLRRIADVDTPVVAVIDGVADVSDPRLLAGIEYLVEYGTGRVHLVVTCQGVPPLPLRRWDVRGRLTHLRPQQLFFAPDDTAALLAAHGVVLTDPALFDLHTMTEGWPAPLRLAALAMQGHPEPDRLVPDLPLHGRGLREYLVGEVLDPVQPDVRDLLRRMSTVDYVTPGLVDALTGRHDGARLLTAVQQSGLMAIRCGGRRPQYRMHPLLRLVLHDELRQRAPDLLVESHRRAADWYRDNGFPADAVRHALAARAWRRAAHTMAEHWPQLLPGRRVRTLASLVPVPPQPDLSDPWLVLALAAERLDAGDLPGAAVYIDLVERLGETGADLVAAIRAVRLAHAAHTAEPDHVLDTVRRTVSAPGTPADVRAFVLLAAGTAYLYQVSLPAAESALTGALDLARRLDLDHCRLTALRHLAVLSALRGSLREALRYVDELLVELDVDAYAHGGDAAWVDIALAEVALQQDRLPAARYHLERALGTAALRDLTPSAIIALVRFRIVAAGGDRYGAAVALATARRQPDVSQGTPVLAELLRLAEADLRLAAGQTVSAQRLVDEAVVVPQLRGWTALSRAKLLLAGRRPADAADLLLAELDAPHPAPVWTVEANLVCAESLALLGEREAADRCVRRALAIAQDEGIRRPFVARGRAAYDLLAAHHPATTEHRRLAGEIMAMLAGPGRAGGTDAAGGPAEPLTERELTVLRYLHSMMSTAEIASVLYVSVNTVKTHIKSIYRKLGTGRRRDAVERAQELNLI